MKVEKDKFDAAIAKLLKAKPAPKKSIKRRPTADQKAYHYAASPEAAVSFS